MKFDISHNGERKIFGPRKRKECTSLSYGFIKSIYSEVKVIQRLLPISFNHLKRKT